MKFKALNNYHYGDDIVMEVDDIVTITDNTVHNLTTNQAFTFSDLGWIKRNLEPIIEDPVTEFEKITTKMNDTFTKKNHDYGNSFEQSLDEEGITAARIRLGDKWNRFKQLSKGEEVLVKDESIEDTLLDMATYCIMTVMWLNKQ